MNTITIDNPITQRQVDLSRPAPTQNAQGFSSLLTAASDAASGAGKSQERRLREAVEQLTASAFVLPMLNEVRNSSLKSDLFGGGFAEDSFRQQLDTVMADRMVAGGNFPVVEAIYGQLAKTYHAQADGARAYQRIDTAA